MRLDNLSRLSHGRKVLADLMQSKDGDKLIEYLATTEGGRQMGEMVARGRDGRNLNRPPGTIYTADDFVRALKPSYAREKKAREEQARKSKKKPRPAGK